MGTLAEGRKIKINNGEAGGKGGPKIVGVFLLSQTCIIFLDVAFVALQVSMQTSLQISQLVTFHQLYSM